MITTIIAVLVLLIVAVVAFAATRPDSFRIERSIAVKSPPEKVFTQINDFHNWGAWSPWEKLDPDLKRTFSGSGSGKGAVYAWVGTPKVGEGRMEILDTTMPSRILIKLDFFKPFEAHNQAEFTMESREGVTHVVWAMTGPQAFPMKVMSLFMSMDSMIGKDFEKGLADLKTLAEA